MKQKLWVDTKSGRKGLILMAVVAVVIWVSLLFTLNP
jgi:hypothetical protein